MDRAKEVGMRKVSGATRKQLIVQFFIDAILINAIAVFLAVGTVTMLLPAFEQLTGSPITSILAVTKGLLNPSFWIPPIVTLLAGIVAVGLYPSLLLSSFKPVLVLKGKFTKSATGIFLRKDSSDFNMYFRWVSLQARSPFHGRSPSCNNKTSVTVLNNC